MPATGLSALRQRARLNEKTIADFTRVVEQTGILERGVAAMKEAAN